MAKPIFFIRVPETLKEYFEIICESLKEMEDYYCFAILSNIEDFEVQLFYEKDFNEVKFDELKEIIKNSIKK